MCNFAILLHHTLVDFLVSVYSTISGNFLVVKSCRSDGFFTIPLTLTSKAPRLVVYQYINISDEAIRCSVVCTGYYFRRIFNGHILWPFFITI